MKRSHAVAALAVLAVVTIGCGEPFVMLPGGELSGTVKPPPASWSHAQAVEDFQLETRPDDPYSVNVWGVGLSDGFYVASGRGLESEWARHIEADPRVRLRIGEDLYELRAERTDRRLDLRRFRAALERKYDDFEPDPEQEAKAVVYRLVPR